MAKFLNTTGVSYHLEELIKGTKDRLILISPYLQFTDRIKEHLLKPAQGLRFDTLLAERTAGSLRRGPCRGL